MQVYHKAVRSVADPGGAGAPYPPARQGAPLGFGRYGLKKGELEGVSGG